MVNHPRSPHPTPAATDGRWPGRVPRSRGDRASRASPGGRRTAAGAAAALRRAGAVDVERGGVRCGGSRARTSSSRRMLARSNRWSTAPTASARSSVDAGGTGASRRGRWKSVPSLSTWWVASGPTPSWWTRLTGDTRATRPDIAMRSVQSTSHESGLARASLRYCRRRAATVGSKPCAAMSASTSPIGPSMSMRWTVLHARAQVAQPWDAATPARDGVRPGFDMGPADERIVSAQHRDVVTLGVDVEHASHPREQARMRMDVVLEDNGPIDAFERGVKAAADASVAAEVHVREIVLDPARPVDRCELGAGSGRLLQRPASRPVAVRQR